jgi:hypothetical protein
MRRDASPEGLKRFSDAQHRPLRPIPTLGKIQQDALDKWVWASCAGYGCNHHAPLALAPFVIRWGPNASSDALRRCAHCSKFDHKGATLRCPSYIDSEIAPLRR